jgi:hypothetical protein
MRRLYPDVIFDWKKLDRQLAEKREACRGYRARRRDSSAARRPRQREAFYSVYDPFTRTVYAGCLMVVAIALISFEADELKVKKFVVVLFSRGTLTASEPL